MENPPNAQPPRNRRATTAQPPRNRFRTRPAMSITLGTPLSPQATRVMLLGGGELGKEVLIALQRLEIGRAHV